MNLEDSIPKLEKLGYNLKNPINTPWARIYDIGNGRVLKITRDISEATNSNKIIGKKLENVNRIFRVFLFKGTRGLYFIEQEKLKPLVTSLPHWSANLTTDNIDLHFKRSLEWAKMLKQKASILWVNPTPFLTDKLLIEDLQYLIMFYLNEKDIVKLIELNNAKNLERMYTGNFDKLAEAISKPVETVHLKGLVNGLKELKSNGISFTDTHQKNAMVRGSQWCWLDLGFGKENKTAGLEIVEDVEVLDIIRHLNEKELKQDEYLEKLEKYLEKYAMQYDYTNKPVGDLQYNQARVYQTKIDKLWNIINTEEDVYPIVVDQNNKILDGHHRVYTIKQKFGNDFIVPVMIIKHSVKEMVYENNRLHKQK